MSTIGCQENSTVGAGVLGRTPIIRGPRADSFSRKANDRAALTRLPEAGGVSLARQYT